MATKRDFYEILGIAKNADDDTIKKAYRKLAMQYHPDRNPGDKASEEKFKECAEAYEILSDADKRARYDRMGHAGVDNSHSGHGPGGDFTMDDIFSQFGDIFGDAFGGRGRSGGGGRPQGQRGSNLRIKVKLTLEEIATGVHKKIKVKKQTTCSHCSGSGAKDKNSLTTCNTCKGSGYVRQVRSTFLGQMQTTAPCTTCNGSGKTITAPCGNCKGNGIITDDETIDLDIPAGVAEGMQLSLSGKGNAGPKGGLAGDLLINIEEEAHPYLQRDGSNLIHELFINFADAAIGTSIEVPTIDGRAKIKVPPGTQAGKIFRLQGKGLPSVQNYGTGDQLVHVNVWIPKRLTEEERRLLEKLRTMPNFNPDASAKSEKGFFDKMKDMFS